MLKNKKILVLFLFTLSVTLYAQNINFGVKRLLWAYDDNYYIIKDEGLLLINSEESTDTIIMDSSLNITNICPRQEEIQFTVKNYWSSYLYVFQIENRSFLKKQLNSDVSRIVETDAIVLKTIKVNCSTCSFGYEHSLIVNENEIDKTLFIRGQYVSFDDKYLFWIGDKDNFFYRNVNGGGIRVIKDFTWEHGFTYCEDMLYYIFEKNEDKEYELRGVNLNNNVFERIKNVKSKHPPELPTVFFEKYK